MAVSIDNEDSGLLTVESQRSIPAPFLTKTYHLVDDPSTNDIISWGEDNTTFVVWRPPEFARDLLPNYFKHNNFSSFVRQLNTYGFRKTVPDRWEFGNEFFKKGEKHLLCEIHRRKTPHLAPASKSSSSVSFQEQASWPAISSTVISCSTGEPGNYQNAIFYLSDENERLRRDNNLLLSELFRLRKLYNDIVLFVQQNERISSLETSSQSSSAVRCPQVVENISFTRKNIAFEVHSPDRSHANRDTSCILTSVDSSLSISLDLRVAHNENSTANVNGSSASLLDEKLSEWADEETEKSPPKLFGVPLHGRKRSHSETDDDHSV